MKIIIITPAPARSRRGNRGTALRWANILRSLGHRVQILNEFTGQSCHLLVALHARRSYASIQRFREKYPERPLILALTGTDLYNDIHNDPLAQQALNFATRFIVLQIRGTEELPRPFQRKTCVIYQSVRTPVKRATPRNDIFEVAVMSHLRPVKDPFRTAEATRRLPPTSQIQVTHLGAALSEEMAHRAKEEMRINSRYHWLGELPRWKALRILNRCRLMVLSSWMEGGPNVLSEALAMSVPVLSSHIAGSVGILGPEYPGYFPAGDTPALAALLQKAEKDRSFYDNLQTHCQRRSYLVEPAREHQSWKDLLMEIS